MFVRTPFDLLPVSSVCKFPWLFQRLINAHLINDKCGAHSISSALCVESSEREAEGTNQSFQVERRDVSIIVSVF